MMNPATGTQSSVAFFIQTLYHEKEVFLSGILYF